MSSSNDNTTYKKTSFLAGNNSEFINEFYSDFISDPIRYRKAGESFLKDLVMMKS